MTDENFEESVDEAKRKLASFQRITALQPIPEKDRIELASILGYKVVVKRGEFKVSDLCVFAECDSFVPVSQPPFDFLVKRAKIGPDGKPRARIQTMKLGTTYSQGLALPISQFPQLARVKAKEGKELTKLLDVIKYEPGNSHRVVQKLTFGRRVLKFVMRFLPYDARVWLGSKFKTRGFSFGVWPADAPPKTDEDRLQSNTYLLDEMRGFDCYTAMKVDGSSFTAFKKNGKFKVCSRNMQIVPGGPSHFMATATKYDLENKLPEGSSIQCELAGPAIQKNRLALTDLKLFCFNVFQDGKQLGLDEALAFCESIGVEHVPILERFKITEEMTVEEMVRKSLDLKWPTGPAEGYVCRPIQIETMRGSRGQKLSFKIINPAFELKLAKQEERDEATKESVPAE